MKQMTFSSTRNEIMRAQTALDQIRTSSEGINGSSIANPSFRHVDKKAWTDQNRPFRVVKVDKKKLMASSFEHSRLSHGNRCDNRRNSVTEPYTGIKDMTLTKKLEDHFSEEKTTMEKD